VCVLVAMRIIRRMMPWIRCRFRLKCPICLSYRLYLQLKSADDGGGGYGDEGV
jgi:hypothetical protein